MKSIAVSCLTVVVLVGCAAETHYDPLEDYREVDAITVLDAPSVELADVAPENRDAVRHGEYLVELLACGACHTDGVLLGDIGAAGPLAGSRIRIAFTTPLENPNPGVVYPPNITPDIDTGIGGWSDQQLFDAITTGKDRFGGRLGVVMPWQGYRLLKDSDVAAIVSYLRNIEPANHRVPANVSPGDKASEPFVYFGVYVER